MKLFSTIIVLLATLTVSAQSVDRQIPQSYYSPIDGKTTQDLKTALYKVINPHTEISSYQALPQYFMRTDVYPESNRWWDMYSNIPLYAPSFRGLNREHSFPKSWWGGDQNIPAYVDLNHLYPSESAANMAKSNYPLGVVDKTKKTRFDNGITVVGVPVAGQGGGADAVFEPDDEYKGDFARTYFYMVTCYQNLSWRYLYMLTNGAYPTLNSWSQKLLLQWSREDPVSQKEIDRNEQIWSIQNNRNPFIDFPELAEYIWGNRMGEAFIVSEHMTGDGPSGSPELITPSQGTTLDFGEVALGHSITSRLHLNGQNLTGQNLRLTIYDNAETHGAGYFSIDGSNRGTASVSAVNSADGMWVTVTYAPTELGTHDTRLVITGGGITGSVGIGLRGECLPVPELTAPTATAATDITATSYTANWTPVEGETVDYYVVNRTRYDQPGAPTEQLVSEENSLLIEDFSGSESYTVQSVRLGIYSPQSNSISVVTGGITGVESGSCFGVNNVPGGLLVTTGKTLENLRIIDASGRIVATIATVENNQVVNIGPGVYLITASGVTKPVKAVVK